MIGLILIASTFYHAGIWSSDNRFINVPSFYSGHVGTDAHIGSWGRNYRRFEPRTVASLYAMFEGYYARGVYSSSGPDNNWDESLYGPRPIPLPRDMSLTKGWGGSFRYRSWNTNDVDHIYVPQTRRLADYSNMVSFVKSGAVRDIIDGSAMMMDRGKSWDPNRDFDGGGRKIRWSSSKVEELFYSGTPFTMEESDNTNLSDGPFTLACFSSSGDGSLLHRAGSTNRVRSVFSEVVGSAWMTRIKPYVDPSSEDRRKFEKTFEDVLTRSFAREFSFAGGGEFAYVYPGMEGYPSGMYTRRIIPDDVSSGTNKVFVSPAAAAIRALSLADVTYETSKRYGNMTNQPLVTYTGRVYDGYASYDGSASVDLPFKIKAGEYGPFGEMEFTDTDVQLSRNYVYGGSGSDTMSSEMISAERFVFCAGPVSRKPGGQKELYAMAFDVIDGCYIEAEKLTNIPTPLPPNSTVSIQVPVGGLYGGGMPNTTSFSFNFHYSAEDGTEFNNEVIVDISEYALDSRIKDLYCTYDVYGASKSRSVSYTPDAPGVDAMKKMCGWMGPGKLAYDDSVVRTSKLFDLYEIAASKCLSEKAFAYYQNPTHPVENIPERSGLDILSRTYSFTTLNVMDGIMSEQSKYAAYASSIAGIYESAREKGLEMSSASIPPSGSIGFDHSDFDSGGVVTIEALNEHVQLTAVTAITNNIWGELYTYTDENGRMGRLRYMYKPERGDPFEVYIDLIPVIVIYNFQEQVSSFTGGPNTREGGTDLIDRYPPVIINARGASMMRTDWQFGVLENDLVGPTN